MGLPAWIGLPLAILVAAAGTWVLDWLLHHRDEDRR